MSRPMMVFELASQRYALLCTAVQEILFMAELSRPATRPPLLEGFLTLDGQAVPVLNLRRLLQQPAVEPGLYTPLIVVRTDRGLLALLVDRIATQTQIPDEACRPAEALHSINCCVQAHVDGPEGTISLLDVGRLLLEQERRCIADLQEMEQERLRALA
ncbi:MAG: chemotaxis protein CheW [Candidatus Xenobia bacterium]